MGKHYLFIMIIIVGNIGVHLLLEGSRDYARGKGLFECLSFLFISFMPKVLMPKMIILKVLVP